MAKTVSVPGVGDVDFPDSMDNGAIEAAIKSNYPHLDPSRAAAPASGQGGQPPTTWQAFSGDSGSLGIPRDQMPQVRAEHHGPMVNYLGARGISHEMVDVDPNSLKPTQAEFSPEKVQSARDFDGGDRAIIVSSDGRIVDGHHQWLARKDDGQPIRAIQLQAPIGAVLSQLRDFPSVGRADGAPAPASSGAPELTDYQRDMLNTGTTRSTGATFDTPTGRSPYPQDQKPVEGSGAGFSGNLKAGFVEDPQTKLQLLAEARFPNDPKAVERFGWRDGHPVFINEHGQLERADAGLLSRAGTWTSNVPEAIGGTVGTLTASPIGGAVAGSVTGKAFKQIIGNLLFDEPQSAGGNAAGLGAEAALTGIGGALGKGVSLAANRTAIPSAANFDAKATQATIDRIRASTGIELDSAQAGGVRGLRDLKKWVSKYPSDAQEVIEALDKKQADQVSAAIQDRLLNKLSSTKDNVALASSAIDGAKGAITLAKQKRAIDTRPLFREAETDQLPGNVVSALKEDPYIANNLKAVLGNDLYSGEFKSLGLAPHAQASSAFSSQLPPSGAGIKGNSENSIKAWDLVLRNMKDAQQAATIGGEANKARLIGQRIDVLEHQLGEASPKYAAARDAWAKATQDYVSPLEDGVVGLIAKQTGPKVAQDIAQIASGDVLTDPAVAASVRGALIHSGQERSWNDMLRLSLGKAFDKASKETQGGDVVNLAGKFRQAVIGTPQQQMALNVAVGKPVAPVLGDLMDALQMIARENRSRSGSDTAFNQAIIQQQQSGALSSLARTATAPASSAREFIDGKMIQRNAQAFADALTDPEKVARLKELRKLKPSQERAIAMLSVAGIGHYALGGAADAVNAPRDSEPEARRGTQ